MRNFKTTHEKPELRIDAQLGGTLRNSLEKKRDAVTKLIEIVIFLCKRGLSLRGHRDSGPIDIETWLTENEGLFRDIVKVRCVGGDKNLRNFVENANANERYTSPTIQNEWIELIGQNIVKTITDEIQAALCIAIQFDETSDISKIEQLCLTVRYMHEGVLKERLVAMVDCYEELNLLGENGFELTGLAFAKIVDALLLRLKIPKNKIAFVGTDGARVLTGLRNGFIRHFAEGHPQIKNIICNSHNLNNAIGAGMKLQAIDEALDLLKKIIAFFSSPKRTHILLKIELEDRETHSKLKSFCATRWSYQLLSVNSVLDQVVAITKALDILATSADRELATNATNLANSMRMPDALLPLYVVQKVLGVLNPTVQIFQKESFFTSDAIRCIESALSTMSSLVDCQEEWNRIYTKAVKSQTAIGSFFSRDSLRNPRHQLNLKERYWNQFLHSICTDLSNRLEHNHNAVEHLLKLMPDNTTELSDDDLKVLCETYSSFFGDYSLENLEECLRNEISTFKKQFTGQWELDQLIKEAKNFVVIVKLLEILSVSPVSNALNERIFSLLRRIKNYLRSTMKEERLNGILLACANNEVEVQAREIFNEFVNKQTRRGGFVSYKK